MTLTKFGDLLPAFGRAVRQHGLLSAAWITIDHPRTGQSTRLKEAFVRTALVAFRLMRRDTVKTRVNGVPLYVDPKNRWSLRELVLRPFYDKAEIETVRRLIPPEYTCFDIGANFGAWTFSLAGHFSRVVAVEPERRCYDAMRRTQHDGLQGNVTIVHAALSDHEGTATLFASDSHIGDGRIYASVDHADHGASVAVLTFDALVERYALPVERMFIKLDVQGVEPRVLRGMTTSLSRAKDVVLFTEVQDEILAEAGFSADAYFEALKELGFEPVDLFAGLRPLAWQDVHRLMASQKDFCFRRGARSAPIRNE